MQKQDLITTRLYIPSDKNFIMATFLRNIYYSNSWFKLIPKNIFMVGYHKVLEALLSSPATSVQVACLKDDPEVILGYAVLGDTTRIHFVFIKKAWRKIGIAKSLVPPTIKVATHFTDVGLSYLSKHPEIIYNPFAL